MKTSDFAKQLLFSDKLEDKLLPVNLITSFIIEGEFEVPADPGRPNGLKISDKKTKFPSIEFLKKEEGRAKALHFFANHELLAIELMALALLKFPEYFNNNIKSQKLLIKTISEEQKHLGLYLERIRELNCELGDYPLNDFFWRYIAPVETISHFYALMALTFEQANLDFAEYYEALFNDVGDKKSANLMRIILNDEIAHVKRGVSVLKEENEGSLWEIYNRYLPTFISPARAKGSHFNKEARLKAGLDEDYITHLISYSDDFKVTNRKQWKTTK